MHAEGQREEFRRDHRAAQRLARAWLGLGLGLRLRLGPAARRARQRQCAVIGMSGGDGGRVVVEVEVE
eukprot:scaffold7454_cov60-Phaeocystis_antarctica.AAC.1